MSDNVSQGARELAQSIVCGIVTDLVPDYIRMALHIDTVKAEEAKAAEFIDRDLREVMAWIEKHGHDATCTSHLTWRKDIWPEGNPPCNCGVSALLAKWTVRG